MRKLFCSVALIAAFSSATIAQTDTTNIDNTAIDTAADQSTKKKRQDLFFIDLNWDYMLGMPSIVTQKYWGRGVNLGLMFDQPINKNNNFSLGIGVGFQTQNYYTDATIETYTDSTGALTSEWIVPGGIVKEKGKITNLEYQKLTGVSKPTSTRDLLELVKKSVFKKFGKTGKGTLYKLKGS